MKNGAAASSEPEKQKPILRGLGSFPVPLTNRTLTTHPTSDNTVANVDIVLNRLNCQSITPVEKIDKINTDLIIDLPKLNNNLSFIDTPTSIRSSVSLDMPAAKVEKVEMPEPVVEKLANAEIRRRRRSMRKHQRKKMMKRIWPKLRKAKFLKFKKKQRQILAYKQKFQDLANNFDAMAYIKENLKVAQDNGYYVNVFNLDVEPAKMAKK